MKISTLIYNEDIFLRNKPFISKVLKEFSYAFFSKPKRKCDQQELN